MRLIDADALNLDREVALADDWNTAHEIANCVKYAPTVDAVPVVHGAWEEETVDSYEENAVVADWQSARCSVCKRYLTTPYMYYFTHYNYCPNCGAKMDAEPKPHENT